MTCTIRKTCGSRPADDTECCQLECVCQTIVRENVFFRFFLKIQKNVTFYVFLITCQKNEKAYLPEYAEFSMYDTLTMSFLFVQSFD